RDQESVFYPSCFFEKVHSGIPILGDRKTIKNLGESVESFERFLRQNKFFYKPNSIKIVIKESANLSVSANEILMSAEQAKDLKLFRKSLLKSWFLGFASKQVRDDKFTQEVVSDIFLYVFWNEINWEKEFNFKRWLKYVYSEKDICRTDFVPAETGPFCDLIAMAKNTQRREFDQISIWSMRPLVVNRILHYYDQMPLKEKLGFAKYWMRFAGTFEGKLPEKNLNFQNFSNVYNMYMEQFIGKLLNAKFEEYLTVDYIFEFDIPQVESLVSFKNELPFYMQKNILFKFKNNTYINLRNGSKLVTSKSLARHWVLVQNSFPELKEVKGLPADYLTIIQAKKDYDLHKFYEKIDDISDFPWVEEFDSLTIYIPSLKLLGRLAPNEVKSQDIKSLSLNPRLEVILGWNPVQVH
ncbi:MAG: hypothetical protein V4596_13715, partial [Bdellovibrionota bacterium]